MEMRMPDGALLSEEFETAAKLWERFADLSAKGGKAERIHIPRAPAGPPEVRREFHRDTSKYDAHQGQGEIERRMKRLAALAKESA